MAAETLEPEFLVPLCNHCGSECSYIKQDRVLFSGVAFIERVLTCGSCGRTADAPAYFPLKDKDECTL